VSVARFRRREHAQSATFNVTIRAMGFMHALSTSVKGAVMQAHVGIAPSRESELVPVGSRSTRN
jgi:hypothetical protein